MSSDAPYFVAVLIAAAVAFAVSRWWRGGQSKYALFHNWYYRVRRASVEITWYSADVAWRLRDGPTWRVLKNENISGRFVQMDRLCIRFSYSNRERP